MARLLGITQKALRSQVTVRFVKVAEYQARGIVHYHAVIRLDAPGDTYQPPPLRYDTALLTAAIQATAAAISCDTVVLLARMLWRAAGANPVDSLPVIDPGLGRILRFGTQIDTRRYPPRPWRAAGHWDSAVSTGGRELHRQIRHQDHRRARTPPPAPFGSRCQPAGTEPLDPHARLPGPLPHQVPPLLGHLHPVAPSADLSPPRGTAPRRRERPLGPQPGRPDRPDHLGLAIRGNRPRYHRRAPACARCRRPRP